MDPFLNVEAPQRVKRVGGIREVAEFDTDAGRIFQGGKVAYAAPECGTALGDAELCFPSEGPEQSEKTFNGIETFEGIAPVDAFYAGSECFIDGEDYESIAEEALEARIDLKIEKAVDNWATADATIGAATGFLEAVADLEDAADADYAGRPVLFINRGDASRARDANALYGNKEGQLWTANGTPVVSSSSITKGRVIMTGAIKVIESPTVTTRTISHTTNREQAIAERAFVVVADCKYLSAANVA